MIITTIYLINVFSLEKKIYYSFYRRIQYLNVFFLCVGMCKHRPPSDVNYTV